MKKILLSFIITTITCLSVNATYSVQYNNAGSATNTGNTFGSNAKFTPSNRAKAGFRNRQIKYEKQYYNGLENRNNINININSDKTNPEDSKEQNTPNKKDKSEKTLRETPQVKRYIQSY